MEMNSLKEHLSKLNTLEKVSIAYGFREVAILVISITKGKNCVSSVSFQAKSQLVP